MRVVINDASGFIGKPLSKILAELGFEVLAVTRKRPDGDSINLLSWLKKPRVNGKEMLSDQHYKQECPQYYSVTVE